MLTSLRGKKNNLGKGSEYCFRIKFFMNPETNHTSIYALFSWQVVLK